MPTNEPSPRAEDQPKQAEVLKGLGGSDEESGEMIMNFLLQEEAKEEKS